MRRSPISIRLASALALVGLIMCSTVVAWAMPCADDCRAMASEHACCAPELDPVDDASLNDPGCCGGSQARCDLSLVYEPDDTSEAHDRSRDVAIERRAENRPSIARISHTRPNLRAGPAVVQPPPTRTVVLLL